MPELPEIETLRRDLISLGLPGRRITDVRIFWERSIQSPSPGDFSSLIRGRRVSGIRRRGKYLALDLEGNMSLLIHFRMTGGLIFTDKETDPDPHDRVIFGLDEGSLVFHDTRKFGRMVLTDEPETILHSLGPEPFDSSLTPELFFSRLTSRKRVLKALLLDQGFIAGLGNIYADESLFAAGLHPLTPSNVLDRSESEKLLRCIREVLDRGIRNRGTSLGDGESNFSSSGRYGRNADSLQVFRRAGKPCPRCAAPVERIIVAQRSTHFCPVCQPLLMKASEHATL
jgi:formamidopyrimidine-DNA glycosylase